MKFFKKSEIVFKMYFSGESQCGVMSLRDLGLTLYSVVKSCLTYTTSCENKMDDRRKMDAILSSPLGRR